MKGSALAHLCCISQPRDFQALSDLIFSKSFNLFLSDIHYLIQFFIFRVPLACPPSEDGRGGVEAALLALMMDLLTLGPHLLLLLHLDGPDLAMQGQRGHSQALILLIAVKIIEIPAAIILSAS